MKAMMIILTRLFRKSARDWLEKSLFKPVIGLILLNFGARALMVKRTPTWSMEAMIASPNKVNASGIRDGRNVEKELENIL